MDGILLVLYQVLFKELNSILNNSIDTKQVEISEKSNKDAKEEEIIQVIVNCEKNKINLEQLKEMGTVKYVLPMINSYVLEVKQSKIGDIEGVEGVIKVEEDAHLMAQMNKARDIINGSWQEAESNLGESIGVAVLDTGIYPHEDFVKNTNRLIAFKDFVNDIDYPYDDNGHGTHVAGIVGGDGYESDNDYRGIAPKCNLIGVKVLNKNGSGNISDVLAGLQWILDKKDTYNIKVINLSVGMEDIDCEQSTLVKGVNVLWDQGLVVVCAAGNNGPKKGSITTPGVSRKVITVGSSDDKNRVNVMGNYIANYSSRGPTIDCIKKPDIIAPGSNIISCSCDNDYIGTENYPEAKIGYTIKSGTSMATPIVSGIFARILSDIEGIKNIDIKIALIDSGNDLGLSKQYQGWGLIDMKKLYENILKKDN